MRKLLRRFFASPLTWLVFAALWTVCFAFTFCVPCPHDHDLLYPHLEAAEIAELERIYAEVMKEGKP